MSLSIAFCGLDEEEPMDILIVAILAFSVCFAADHGFQKLFRNKVQHRSGLSVRANKYYAVVGIVVFIFGIAGLFAGIGGKEWLLIAGSCFLICIGLALNVYYLTFGLFYDDDSFIRSVFGKKSVMYHYGDIVSQQLYRSGRTVIIELQLSDGKTVDLQSGMSGVYAFMDQAFAGWCRQKGIDPADCPFHDPDNSCWFPAAQEEE